MFSVLAIITSHGDVLIKEEYIDNVKQQDFNHIVSNIVKDKYSSPSIKENGTYGHFIKKDKLIFLLVAKQENPNFVAFHFLESFYAVIKNFCGTVTEDAIEKNLVLIHELMLESVENGYIQTTNTEQLRAVVYTDPVPTKSDHKKPGLFGLERAIVPGSASSGPLVKSRSQQNFKSDEVFVDVIDKITVHFSQHGVIELFCLTGTICIKSFISQSHSLLVSLNDDLSLMKNKEKVYATAVHLDAWSFADCVDSSEFDSQHSFTIHPPQGEVVAFRYRIESTVPSQLPFMLISSLEESETSRDLNLTLNLQCNIPGNAKALNITVHIPVSSATRNVMQQFSIPDSTADFLNCEKKIVWRIKSLPGYSEVTAKFKLIDAMECAANKLEVGPVAVEFEVSNFVCSGINIKNVKAKSPSSVSIPMQKWVRYITSTDSYMLYLHS